MIDETMAGAASQQCLALRSEILQRDVAGLGRHGRSPLRQECRALPPRARRRAPARGPGSRGSPGMRRCSARGTARPSRRCPLAASTTPPCRPDRRHWRRRWPSHRTGAGHGRHQDRQTQAETVTKCACTLPRADGHCDAGHAAQGSGPHGVAEIVCGDGSDQPERWPHAATTKVEGVGIADLTARRPRRSGNSRVAPPLASNRVMVWLRWRRGARCTRRTGRNSTIECLVTCRWGPVSNPAGCMSGRY